MQNGGFAGNKKFKNSDQNVSDFFDNQQFGVFYGFMHDLISRECPRVAIYSAKAVY